MSALKNCKEVENVTKCTFNKLLTSLLSFYLTLCEQGRVQLSLYYVNYFTQHNLQQDAQLSQRDRAVGCIIVEKKLKIKAITAFEVIQGHRGRHQSKARICDSLVINSNWHPISYRFRVIAAYCSNFGHCVFESPLGVYRQRTMFILGSLESV